jgi:AraC-like DNA-binding protein
MTLHLSNISGQTSKVAIAKALGAFRVASGMQICYHDYSKLLLPFLPEEYQFHLSSECISVKGTGTDRCHEVDAIACRHQLQTHKQAFLKFCHGGRLELVCPIVLHDSIAAALFTGPLALVDAVTVDLELIRMGNAAAGFRHKREERALDRDALVHLFEITLMLKARVESILAPVFLRGTETRSNRRDIERFFLLRAAEPVTIADLAQHVNLSNSRAGHLLKEMFGKTFRQMLSEARITRAKEFLICSDLPASTISAAVGYSDPTYFHRVFSKYVGETPLAFRASEKGRTKQSSP